MNLDDLQKSRPTISSLIKKMTDGEIIDFDFIVDYVSSPRGNGVVTILFSIPAKVKRKYDMDTDAIIMNHLDTITDIFTVAGFPELVRRSVRYQVL